MLGCSSRFWIEVICGVVIVYMCIILILTARIQLTHDVPMTMAKLDVDMIRTGDILVVGYRHVMGMFVTTWSASEWSHTGIAYRDKAGRLWVMEAANYYKPYIGTFRIPFRDWLNINRKSHLGIVRYRGPKAFPEDALDAAFRVYEGPSGMKLDTFNLSWHRFLQKEPYTEPFRGVKGPYTCYELTLILLQTIGVVDRINTCSSYTPGDIAWGRIHWADGHAYDHVIGWTSDTIRYYSV